MISSLPEKGFLKIKDLSKKNKENIGMIENLNHRLFNFAMNVLKLLTRLPKSTASSGVNLSPRRI
jgi:hypothetical protein